MIFFTNKTGFRYKAFALFRETSVGMQEASDAERLKYTEAFLEEHEDQFECLPNDQLLENLANLLLRPYIGNKELDHKILSSFSLERREQKQSTYMDEVKYVPGKDMGDGRTRRSRTCNAKVV